MDEIQLVPYDPAWPQKFEAERALILSCFPVPPLRTDHIGSTAVPGLSAKPVIDIIVLVADLAEARATIPVLEDTGYSYWRDNPDTARLFLAKGLPPNAPQRTHHLHIVADPAKVEHHVTFRDQLRASPSIRREYEELKHALASRYPSDREAYTQAKTAFIRAIVEKATQH